MLYTSVLAHRGACIYAPENTIPAFLLAARLGADGIELDLRVTKDGHAVVCHDATVDRTSNGSGEIVNMTLSELKELDFGYPADFGGRFRGTRIPTLDEVYEAVKQTGMVVNVELEYHSDQQDIVPIAYEITKKHGMNDRVIYSCFTRELVIRMKNEHPETNVASLLYHMERPKAAEEAANYNAAAIHPTCGEALQDGYIKNAHALGLRVHPWVADDEETINRLLAAGADSIITNKPDLVSSIRNEYLKKFI